MPSTASPNRTRILVSFCCVYVFWGGTYLAMRYGVEVLPPFVLASARYLIAGPIMLALSAIFKLKMRPSRQEWGRLVIIGVLMLGCGNTAVMWAEQYIPSGLAALLVASIPLYAALIEMALPQGEGCRRKVGLGWASGLREWYFCCGRSFDKGCMATRGRSLRRPLRWRERCVGRRPR
jgi:drug/metabolite transporter (DMT)-like permease